MTTAVRHTQTAVLCACIQRRATTAGMGSLDGIGDNFDWDALLATATAHGVAELLIEGLASAAVHVPPTILADLTRRELEATGQNLARVTQVVEVLRLLADHQVRALTFKGPALAQGVYGHPGRRVSNDIDILVDRRDVARVRPLLLAEGYRLPPRAPRRGGSLLYGLVPSVGREDTLLPGRPGQTSVDVHVAFAYWTVGIRLDVDAMFDRAVVVDVAGHTVPTLDPEDLLLVLAIHGMMHGWRALRLVADINALVDLVSDWDRVVRGAEKARMSRVLWVALLLARQVLGTALPPAVVAGATGDGKTQEIVDAATRRMFDPDAATASFNHHRWLLLFLEGAHRRFGYHARNVIEWSVLQWPWDAWLDRRGAEDA